MDQIRCTRLFRFLTIGITNIDGIITPAINILVLRVMLVEIVRFPLLLFFRWFTTNLLNHMRLTK